MTTDERFINACRKAAELRPVKDFAGYYVDEFGNVYSMLPYRRCSKRPDKPRLLKTSFGSSKYPCVNLYRNGTRHTFHVHRLVLEAFSGRCPDGMEACHNDGDSSNNSIANLRWDTRLSNRSDRILHGKDKVANGERVASSKLNEHQVRVIRRCVEFGMTRAETARIFSVNSRTVGYIYRRKLWAHI